MLRVAAVGGPRVDDELLRRVCPLKTEELDAALGELLDCHVLEPDAGGRGYVFRHALTAQAVYENVLPGERVRLHAAFAQAIGEVPTWPPPAEFSLLSSGRGIGTGPATAARRCRAWVEAATAAGAVYATPEAFAAYENALELWPIVDGAASWPAWTRSSCCAAPPRPPTTPARSPTHSRTPRRHWRWSTNRPNRCARPC